MMDLINIGKKVDSIYLRMSCTRNGGKRIFHPEYTNRKEELDLIRYFVSLGTKSKIVDYGCGLAPYKFVCPEDWYGVDIHNGENVDLVVVENDFSEIRMAYSHLICTSVLEHVTDLEMFVRNFEKQVPSGTICLFTVPFLVHEHGAPMDYRRFTTEGLEQIFKNHKILKKVKLYGFGFCFSRMVNTFINSNLSRNYFLHSLRILFLPLWTIVYTLVNVTGLMIDNLFHRGDSIFYNSTAILFVKIT